MDLYGARLEELVNLIAKVARDGQRSDRGRRFDHANAGIELSVRPIKGRITLVGREWALSFVGTPRPRSKAGRPLTGSEVQIGDQVLRLKGPCSLIGEDAFAHQMTLLRLFWSEWEIE